MMDIAVTLFIIGMLTGMTIFGLMLSVGVALGGGHLCFSRDGISCAGKADGR